MKSDQETFKEFVEEAKKDSNIIGFFLSGSRGKNRETKFSDYDIEVVIKDKVAKSYKNKYEKRAKPPFGFSVFSLSEFRKHAEIGSPFEWDRPSYTYVKAVVDKTGEIQKLIDEKGKIPKGKIKEYVAGYLDGYINGVYRSLKCFRDDNPIGARLEASRSIHFFLNTIFGLDGRTTSYYKYLEWELEHHTLKKFPMKPKEIITSLLRILEDGDVRTQQNNNWEAGSINLIKTFKTK